MREFTKEEFATIKMKKYRCIHKAEGEQFTLTSTRYTRECIGYLPGTWLKIDRTLKFIAEISPAGENELRFRITGMVPSLHGDGAPSIRFEDIYDRTFNYAEQKLDRYPYWAGNEIGLIVSRFHMFLNNIVRGYSLLIWAMKSGYRFGNLTETSLEECLRIPPDVFMK